MTDNALTLFQHQRPQLAALAYRMLGSVSEAEDILQDAWLRWQGIAHGDINNPAAYLSTLVSRLCLDRWKEARHRREHYVGEWLPEPLVAEAAPDAEHQLEQEVCYALMLALERLSPLERAAFLLHDVFELPFQEVARALARSEPACRQLARRARDRVRAERPRFPAPPPDGERLAEAFFTAARSGDESALRQLLVEDARLHSDGGGVRPAALRRIDGVDRLCRLFLALARKSGFPRWVEALPINGQPGWLSVEQDGTLQTTALTLQHGRVTDVYITRNPHKLSHLAHRVPADAWLPLP